ncbi:MAG: hypothetical protein WCF04_08025 [Candidatus Nanopelagicales bacterium]
MTPSQPAQDPSESTGADEGLGPTAEPSPTAGLGPGAGLEPAASLGLRGGLKSAVGLGPRAGRDWLFWAASRTFLVGIILGWIPWAEQVHDLAIYADWAAQSLSHGQFPTDQMWQYPPLAGPVFLLGAALPGERFGFVLLFLAFDAAIMAMAGQQALRTGRPGGRRLWALVPVIVGPLLLARFDVVPTAFAVAAVLLAGRPAASGAVAAIGTWLKVWPALMIAGLRRSDIGRGIAGALGATLVIVAALAMTTRDPMSFLAGQRDRGLQIESVAALPFLLAKMLGAPVEVVYRFGAHEIEAPGAAAVARACTIATLALLALVAALRLRGRLERLPAPDVGLAVVLFTVVTSRVFSGQYFIWLLGLAAVGLADPASRMRRTTALLVGAGLATHLIYPWLYSALLAANPVAVVVQTVRVALTVAATVAALGVLTSAGGGGQASGSRPARSLRSRSAERSQPQDDSTH